VLLVALLCFILVGCGKDSSLDSKATQTRPSGLSSATKAPGTEDGTVDAAITDLNGKSTFVTQIQATTHASCKGILYYSNIATEINTDSDSIVLSMDNDGYQVSIPLDIVKEMRRQKQYQWEIVLSDNTRLVGIAKTFETFKARTELGDYYIPFEYVSRVTFRSPKSTLHLEAYGSSAATLYLTDTEKRAMTGATFLSENKNENGCFIGFIRESSTHFVPSGAATYEITLDNIREFRFVKDNSANILLVSATGAEYPGYISGVGVEGISRVGTFDLLITVPFSSSAKRLTVERK
jgi:hypothetical protein